METLAAGGYVEALVAVALFVIAQAVIMIRNWGRQTAIQEQLTKTVDKFCEETGRRFDKQDEIILGHTRQLTDHHGRLGRIEGQIEKS